MDIEVIVDDKYKNTKIAIYTNKLSDDITCLIDYIKNQKYSKIYGFLNDTLYFLNLNDIFLIYSENGKVYAKTNENTYLLKYRLYQLEELLDNNFIRISNSEIINIKKVKNLDFSIFGTIKINFINNTYTYASRRFIKKIKDYLKRRNLYENN